MDLKKVLKMRHHLEMMINRILKIFMKMKVLIWITLRHILKTFWKVKATEVWLVSSFYIPSYQLITRPKKKRSCLPQSNLLLRLWLMKISKIALHRSDLRRKKRKIWICSERKRNSSMLAPEMDSSNCSDFKCVYLIPIMILNMIN